MPKIEECGAEAGFEPPKPFHFALKSIFANRYSLLIDTMTDAHAHVDKPEPRWQALLAMAAVGGVYLALPRELVIGPTWLLPTVIAVLLAPDHLDPSHGAAFVQSRPGDRE